MASISSMEVSEQNFVKQGGEKRKGIKGCDEELGGSSTSSVATITSRKSTKKSVTKIAQSTKDVLKFNCINKFKEVPGRVYEQIFKFNDAANSVVKPLLTIANDYEKILIELIQENARLSGRVEGLEKAIVINFDKNC
uniref:Uncharacterized protein n=1 Tax=Glossina austeni TaxID=7395 RepID=A0A1A9VDD0_GLOAU